MPEDRSDNPVINPVLSLTSKPRLKGITGGGKNQDSIKQERLGQQRKALSEKLEALLPNAEQKAVSGYIAIVISMFSDSLAPSYAPNDLFGLEREARLIAPYKGGYLAEIKVSAIKQIADYIKKTDSVKCRVDISRIHSIEGIGTNRVLGAEKPKTVFDQAIRIIKNGAEFGEFVVWFVPFSKQELRVEAIKSVANTLHVKGIASTETNESALVDIFDPKAIIALPLIAGSSLTDTTDQNFIASIYAIALSDTKQLSDLAASGKVIRIDPIVSLASTEITVEGARQEPEEPIDGQPIVGVIDGGRTAQSYAYAEAWKAPELVSTSIADSQHGNSVTSLLVRGHTLNPELELPELICRVGTAQVLVRQNFLHKSPHPNALIAYLDKTISDNPDTKVWNISANTNSECAPFEVSVLGHAITTLARKHNILPIISAGNKLANENLRIAPPADCEAGLVVSGRQSDENGHVGAPCPNSRCGLGPDEMLKPDMSWFSTVNAIGDRQVNGTSFSAPLVSRLAAHAWEKLRTPSPDLVKALLLNNCDLEKFDHQMGWGSPVISNHPWECETGTVCLAWSSKLKAGVEHYWDGITIPPSLLDGNALRGQVSLTAVLDPSYLNIVGVGNYCMARLEVSLQDAGESEEDEASNVLGSMQKRLTEFEARKIDHKWSPIRRHANNFRGKTLRSDKLRLRARIFVRDL
ncbi:MAG: S8 family peptidase, partial [Desulfobulbaceae bacterium]|nr:S8 family peptidase [Desulfobulbaceae bacterium]